MMNNPPALLSALEANVGYIHDRYLLKYKGVEDNSKELKYDLKAFYILTHAEFEEFFENIGLYVLNETVEAFILNKRVNKYLFSILLNCENSVKDKNDTVFNITKALLENFKKKHSASIKDNNGMSCKNLKTMFNPLGIETDIGTKNNSSINRFSTERCEYAHTSKIVETIPSIKDVENITNDVMEVCKFVVEDINKNLPGVYVRPLVIGIKAGLKSFKLIRLIRTLL